MMHFGCLPTASPKTIRALCYTARHLVQLAFLNMPCWLLAALELRSSTLAQCGATAVKDSSTTFFLAIMSVWLEPTLQLSQLMFSHETMTAKRREFAPCTSVSFDKGERNDNNYRSFSVRSPVIELS